MKPTEIVLRKAALAGALVLAFAATVFAQTSPQFTSVSQTGEQAIRLAWSSQSNHSYQIQCADQLAGNPDGSTAWQLLYDNYPSQGTNTFWLDTGNYLRLPLILHPKYMATRFYRILDYGLDDLSSDEPAVSIVTPTNGFVASGGLTITVAASTDQAEVLTKLFVDGQEMWPSDDGSNYVINTCEWANGPHVLFATAECISQLEGPDNAVGLIGRAVSPFVPVMFSNLVTRISFSQVFFQPSLGQTQQVGALFAANVNWTLQIRDIYSNEVRSATGSGASMLFNWDGTGDGGTNLPAGVYYYYISAQTNGQAPQSPGSGGSDASSMSSMSLSGPGSGSSTQLWARPADGSGPAAPLVLYALGHHTNGLVIYERSSADTQTTFFSGAELSGESGGGGDPLPAGYGGPASEATPAAPERPATAPMANSPGTYGVGYQMYNANGTNPVYASPLTDNSGIQGTYVSLESNPGTLSLPWAPQHEADRAAWNFIAGMDRGGWTMNLFQDNDNLKIFNLVGSSTPFNGVNLGLLILHGTYGTSPDYTTGRPVRQIYLPIASGAAVSYLRMSQMSLGGDQTNGLKWMAILACNSLFHADWSSMQSQQVYPYNSNLHLLLGVGTFFALEPTLAQNWADLMLGNATNAPMTILTAWYAAAKQAYAESKNSYINPTVFAVAGDNACKGDYLQNRTNTVLSGSWFYDSQQVYPP